MLSSSRRVLAATVCGTMLAAIAPPPAAAREAAQFQGRVLSMDGVTPLGGVIVTLVQEQSRSTFPSGPTDSRGAFQISAPSGTYTLVAATERGAFLASGPVTLREGKNPPLALTLKEEAPEPAEPPQPQPPEQATKEKGALEGWPKWVVVGGIVVGGLYLLDELTKDEKPASGF